MEERVELSCFDLKFAGLETLQAYFFDGVLDHEILFQSLQEAVKTISPMSSVLKVEIIEGVNFPRVYFQNPNPSNVKFVTIEKRTDEAVLFNLGRPSEDGIINFRDTQELNNVFEHIELSTNLLETPILTDTPLVIVTYVILEKTKKSILGISHNHSLVDLSSFLRFMKQWEYFYNKKTKNESIQLGSPQEFSFDRSPLRPSENFLESPHSKFLLEPDESSSSTSSAHKKKKKKYWVKQIIFTKERISELKKIAKTSLSQRILDEGLDEAYFRFSSHDVISAHIWKLFSPIGANESLDNRFPLLVHIDFRNRVEGIDGTYFGNAAHIVNTVLTREEVMTSKFGDLCFRIRKMVRDYSAQDVQLAIDDAQKNLESPEKKKKKYDWNNGIYLNDWRWLGQNLPCFGRIKCLRDMVIPGLSVPDHGFRFYMHHHPDGVAINFPLEDELYKRTIDLDISSPEAVKEFEILSKYL